MKKEEIQGRDCNGSDEENKRLMSAALRLASNFLRQEPRSQAILRALKVRATAEPGSRVERLVTYVDFWLERS
jgi:hypothetical protein